MFVSKKGISEGGIGTNGEKFLKINQRLIQRDKELDKVRLSFETKIMLLIGVGVAAFIALGTALKAQEVIDSTCYTEVAGDDSIQNDCNVLSGLSFEAELLGTFSAESSLFKKTDKLAHFQGYLEESGYEINDIEGFQKFVDIFGDTLEYLEGFVLTGEDINIAMNLYGSWLNKNTQPEEYISAYREFIEIYPNPEIDLISRLKLLGIELYEGEAA